MYLLFAYHHILPSAYEDMSDGEQTVLRAFMHYQIEQINGQIERMNDDG